jgi:hypothetical protein
MSESFLAATGGSSSIRIGADAGGATDEKMAFISLKRLRRCTPVELMLSQAPGVLNVFMSSQAARNHTERHLASLMGWLVARTAGCTNRASSGNDEPSATMTKWLQKSQH